MTARVLIVDDSPTMRQILSSILGSDDGIEVVGAAADALEARTMIKELDPDVLTLDVEMPGMNGVDFLNKIMTLRPMPVVMISNHTKEGAEVSLNALAEGAFCCLPKPRMDNEAAMLEMRTMVKLAARSSDTIKRNANTHSKMAQSSVIQPVAKGQDKAELIAIGSSTGGVEALTTLFSGFPRDCPPTVVVQHMPASFTSSFASRLDGLCLPNVIEATNQTELKTGNIYIAPGSVGHTSITKNGVMRSRITPGEPESGHMPAVDVLFKSICDSQIQKTTAIILTGMGSDGAKGLLKLREAGANTICQDEATSVVNGMPGAAVKLGAANQVLPIQNIAGSIFS